MSVMLSVPPPPLPLLPILKVLSYKLNSEFRFVIVNNAASPLLLVPTFIPSYLHTFVPSSFCLPLTSNPFFYHFHRMWKTTKDLCIKSPKVTTLRIMYLIHSDIMLYLPVNHGCNLNCIIPLLKITCKIKPYKTDYK